MIAEALDGKGLRIMAVRMVEEVDGVESVSRGRGDNLYWLWVSALEKYGNIRETLRSPVLSS